MRNHKILLTTALLGLTMSFQACQKSELNELQSAQLCLNSASSSAAMNCVSKISANSSSYADALRCSAIFISQGFSQPNQFMDALNAINGANGGCTGGCSSTVAVLTSFNFTGGTTIASNAFTYCTNSKIKFYAQISSLFNLGTKAKAAAGVANGSTPTADEIKTGIGLMTDAEVGQIASTTYTSVCSDTTNASAETKKYCTELSTAYSKGSTDAQIGSCMKLLLQGSTCP